MRKAFLIIMAILCLCTMGFSPPFLSGSDLADRAIYPEQLRAIKKVPIPVPAASATIMVDLVTGRILYANNEHERRSPASITKLVTAVVALEHGDLNQIVTVMPVDLAATSRGSLANGENLTMQQLLGMMLVCSDNAAASAVARTLSGGDDYEVFVGWMNEVVARWGLQDTHFMNPHGLDQEGHYSSAYDLAIIARNAMLVSFIADSVKLTDVNIAGHQIPTTNELLRSYNGLVGVKTGTTDAAGESLAAMAVRPQGQVLTVLLNSPDRFGETTLLMDYYYANFYGYELKLTDNQLNRYQDADGAWHTLYIRDAYTDLLTPTSLNQMHLYRRLDETPTNPQPDVAVGALEVYRGHELVTSVPLYAR
ncbi:MAG: D-alanyl-D-alanine carboxypeptidase [Chloroflexi bacterium]|nr:D-alanyl-D-alanine carboxypeptidase [Chloroflexota bacterium]